MKFKWASLIAVWIAVAFCLLILGVVAANGAECCPPGGDCAPPAWRAAPIGVSPIAKTRPAVRGVSNICRVENHRGRYMDGGSGVLVYSDTTAGYAQVVTVAHIFTDGRGRVVVTFGSRQFAATISHVDPIWDFAVLRIACPSGIRPVRIVTTAPAVGAKLHAGGFPRGGPFRWIAGRCRGFVGVQARRERWWIQMTGIAQQGDSGGIVCDGSGSMVGLISSTGGGCIVGPWVGVMRPHIGPPKQNTRPPASAGPPAQDALAPGPAGGGHLQDTAAVIAELRAEMAALRALVTEFQPMPGPPGRDGVDGSVDIDALAAEVKRRLPPWYLRTINEQTGVETIEAIPLGEGFTLRLHPHEE